MKRLKKYPEPKSTYIRDELFIGKKRYGFWIDKPTKQNLRELAAQYSVSEKTLKEKMIDRYALLLTKDIILLLEKSVCDSDMRKINNWFKKHYPNQSTFIRRALRHGCNRPIT